MMNYFFARAEMTDRQIAAKIKLSPAYISMIRRGYIPSFEKADALAKIMNCSVEAVFPRYIRTSQLPTWKEMKYLVSEGYDLSAYGGKDPYLA